MKHVISYATTEDHNAYGNLGIRKLLHSWEQFKEAAVEAEKLVDGDIKSYVVFAPHLKSFHATKKPMAKDEIVLTFGTDIYDMSNPVLGDFVAAFDAWCDYNVSKLYGEEA